MDAPEETGPGRIVYAIVVLLAFLAALEQRDTPPWESIAAVWLTLLGTALAEAYALWVSHRIQKVPTLAALSAALRETLAFGVPGAVVTFVYVLQWLGVERAAQANSIANGALLGMLFMLGFGSSWHQRPSLPRALAEATLVTCVGALVVAVKLVIH